MELSRKILSVVGSVTLEIDAKAKSMRAEGIDVVGFGAGEPDFDTPAVIKEAAKEALDKGFTKYTPAAGMISLKQAICDKLAQQGLSYAPGEIVISNGAKHSLFNAFSAILNPGDEVIIPSPFWVSYPEIVKMADGVPVFVQSDEKNDFALGIDAIRAAITGKTKALVLNSPNNPTGVIFSQDSLQKVAELAKKHGFFVISDEIYNELVYDIETPRSIAALEGMKDYAILVNGMSKAYSMTGWRIGYTASPAKVAKAMGNFQSHATSNPNSIAQYASIAALRYVKQEIEDMKAAFIQRRQYMYDTINGIPGLSCPMPDGAFYVFMNISGAIGKQCGGKAIQGSVDFSSLLLDQQKVAVVPGIAFGADSYVRLSYATSMENIIKGLSCIRLFMESLQ
ncbi:MAG: pyridoxal phosphate-dependent aminotransferase [Christensenellales bacterium]